MDYFLHILILIGIYIILSIGLNLIVGYTGLLSIAHAAFYGIGAYISALLALHFGWSFWGTILVGAMGAGLLGAMVAIPALRVRGAYLVIASFGFQVIIHSTFNNLVFITRGPMGLPGIPQPHLFNIEFSSVKLYLILIFAFVSVVIFLTRRIISSPLGRVLKAIRENEVATLALGKNVVKFKVLIFVLGAFLAGIAGSLYAHYITFIDPSSFTVEESILILSMIVVGGLSSLNGSILGAIILVSFPEILRFLGVPHAIAAPLRQMFYGALLVVLMRLRPQGLWGEYEFK